MKNPSCIEFGKNVRIKDGCRIECYKSFAGETLLPRLILRDNIIIGFRFSALVTDQIEIGKNTILASDILITSENHGMNPELPVPYHKQPLSSAPVKIGEGCWIGEKVTILPGTSIGEKCIIAAGAVVSADIPSYSIAAGVPAKVIKQYSFEAHEWIPVRA